MQLLHSLYRIKHICIIYRKREILRHCDTYKITIAAWEKFNTVKCDDGKAMRGEKIYFNFIQKVAFFAFLASHRMRNEQENFIFIFLLFPQG